MRSKSRRSVRVGLRATGRREERAAAEEIPFRGGGKNAERQKAARKNMYRGARTIAQRLTVAGARKIVVLAAGQGPGQSSTFSLRPGIITPLGSALRIPQAFQSLRQRRERAGEDRARWKRARVALDSAPVYARSRSPRAGSTWHSCRRCAPASNAAGRSARRSRGCSPGLSRFPMLLEHAGTQRGY